MDSQIRLRAAEGSDAPAVGACVHAAYSHYIDRLGKPPGPMLDDYAAVIEAHRVFVAEAAGAIAGVLVLVQSESSLLLDNVAVQPDWQGHGVGRMLLQHAETVARELGFGSLDLYTHELMSENIAMYLRVGYVETGRRTVRGYARVYMRKAL